MTGQGLSASPQVSLERSAGPRAPSVKGCPADPSRLAPGALDPRFYQDLTGQRVGRSRGCRLVSEGSTVEGESGEATPQPVAPIQSGRFSTLSTARQRRYIRLYRPTRPYQICSPNPGGLDPASLARAPPATALATSSQTPESVEGIQHEARPLDSSHSFTEGPPLGEREQPATQPRWIALYRAVGLSEARQRARTGIQSSRTCGPF